MAENSEVIIIQLSNPGESFPEDLDNIVMSTADGANVAMPEGTSNQGIAIPIGNADQFTVRNTSEEIDMPIGNKDQITMENSIEEIAAPVQSNGQELTLKPEVQTMSETYFCDVNTPFPGEKQEDPSADQKSIAETPQEDATVTTEEDTSNVIGITHADGVLSVDIPLSDVMADPSITQTTSVVVNTEDTIPTYTDTHEMSIASTALTETQVTLSKPQPRIILKTNTQVSPSSSPSTSPVKKVVIPAGICVKSYLDDQVAYKITTSDVTEAISAVRTTSSQVSTTKLAPKSTTAKSRQTHQLVVTSMGLVRKALISDCPPSESTTSIQKFSTSPVGVTTTTQPTPTENTLQTFTLTDTHPSPAPLIPENEMVQSSHVEQLHGESLSGIGMSESGKQEENMSSENMEVGSYMTIDPIKKIKEEMKDEEDMASPVRKSYRAPKRKVVKDYEEIGVTPEDESQPAKKRAKTVTVTSPRKPAKGKLGRKPGPKPKSKLTVEEVYKSEDDGEEEEDIDNDFLKVCMIKCDKCDKHFLDKKKLALHKNQVHKTKRGPRTSGKEHICDVCGYVFKRREHWRRHKEVHQKSRPHTCEVCNKTFKRAEHVKRHQSVHFTNKPFPCLECSSAFTRPDHLAKHMLLHNDPEGYRQRRLAKKKKGNAGRGRPRGKGSKMIKTMPRGRGKVTVELREKVKPRREEEDFEYGDVPDDEYDDLETDEGDLLSTDEEERGGYDDDPKPTSLEKVY